VQASESSTNIWRKAMPINVGNYDAKIGTAVNDNMDRMAANVANKDKSAGEKIQEFEDINEDSKAIEAAKDGKHKITDMYTPK
jgi:hypothetical protein